MCWFGKQTLFGGVYLYQAALVLACAEKSRSNLVPRSQSSVRECRNVRSPLRLTVGDLGTRLEPEQIFWLVTQSFLPNEEKLRDEPKKCLRGRRGGASAMTSRFSFENRRRLTTHDYINGNPSDCLK